jgi:superfamily I DNA and RNA helicase
VTELPEIKEIRRLELRPNDIIVLRYDVRMRVETIDQIKENVRKVLGVSNKVVVLDSGARLDILAPTGETAV